MDEHEKGEWAEVADEGIVPAEESDAKVVGETTGADEPATEEGIDASAGDRADAVTPGAPEVPEGAEPDLKDVGAAATDRARRSPTR